ncbi:hypothetical protein TNIN_440281 [Trichonephila inaurata madagascariensis]|uniref:Uncharacterized protein n=1 Tax=Trichonephila inaurata madagascariensis TaxID=2747483 RepID=A0A8X6YX68_9ARAC|nr:hypothetical protein TNIN_440281 [Trichonephila inaurata madagascariensis]
MGIKRKRTSEAYDRLQNINSLPDLLCTNSTEFLVLSKLLSVAIESFSRSLSSSEAKEPVRSRKESLDHEEDGLPFPLQCQGLSLSFSFTSSLSERRIENSKKMGIWIILSTFLAVQIGQCLSCEHRGVECIDYEVISRHPRKRKWSFLSRAQINLYKKLFRYIQGDNLRGEFINSTTPTRTKVVPCKDDSMCEPTYTMSLLVPKDLYDDKFPIPTDVDLFFEREPPKKYVVRSFGGRPSESQWVAEAQKLADLTLKEAGVARDHYYLNWYDPPTSVVQPTQ